MSIGLPSDRIGDVDGILSTARQLERFQLSRRCFAQWSGLKKAVFLVTKILNSRKNKSSIS